MADKQRGFADKTRAKILTAAIDLFVKQGFGATSMQAIADRAAVNQALLYHHFNNKKQLWQRCKTQILEQTMPKTEPLDANQGLHAVLTKIIQQRTKLYTHKKITRIMLWQHLEPSQQGLLTASTSVAASMQWSAALSTLQERGEMQAHFNIDHLICWIASSVSGVIFGKALYLKNEQEQIEQYTQLLIDSFYQLLKT